MTVVGKGGRPATGRIRHNIMFTLAPATMQALDVLSEYMGKPRSRVMDDAVKMLAEHLAQEGSSLPEPVLDTSPAVVTLSKRLLQR